jgi:hypothetical protein
MEKGVKGKIIDNQGKRTSQILIWKFGLEGSRKKLQVPQEI